jgi:hypothetical protein
MRVWGYTAPNLLNRKHLLGGHVELHVLEKGGWKNHPESLAKRFSGDDGIWYLRLHHELLRIAMMQRWGSKHAPHKHATPVVLKGCPAWVVEAQVDYSDILMKSTNAQDCQDRFVRLMTEIHFPLTALDCDDPWTRDGMTMQEYLEVGDDWQLEVHKRGVSNG